MDTQELTLIATVKAKEGQRDFVRDEIIKLLVPTRQEEGCMTYFLHEDNKDPNCFVLYETWANHALWQQHMDGVNIAVFTKATENAVEKWEIQELTKYNA